MLDRPNDIIGKLRMMLPLAFQRQRENIMRRLVCLPLLLLLLSWLLSCANRPNQSSDRPPPTPQAEQSRLGTAKIDAPGLHNVYRITDKLFSGSSPEGDEGFRSLQELGIKTVISVDGARPDVDSARKYGFRNVHLPFGYDGIPRQRVSALAKAVRDLPGPFYIHCHHGKHRGPTAAAAIHLCMDDKCSVEQAVAEMKRAGTDVRYTGLYAVPQALIRPTEDELSRLPADLPEVAEVSGLAQLMVEIDTRWENLKLVKAAGWKTPEDHADLDPPHEALQIVEQYREADRLEQVRNRPEEFRRWLADAQEKATELEQILRRGKGEQQIDHREIEEAFSKAGTTCTQCHAKYRDLPR
jgi:protein tyrosine phosphatase (PTP) superfamily phosphohydrolase (DUF442 family)